KAETACCRDRPAHAHAAGILLSFRQLVCDSKRNIPGNVAGIGIHRPQMSPWRLLARQGSRARLIDIARSRIAFAPLKPRRRSDNAVASVSIAARPFRVLLNP